MSYRHTADMGEISGFGGNYEKCCQDMLDAGVTWLLANAKADIKVLVNLQIYGIIEEGTPETKALSKAVMEPESVKEFGATGAMHHAVMARLAFIAKNGWDKYREELLSRATGEK